ncbi:MAG: hypothetical protein ACYSTO_05725 [Planctomycetota bacterium]
MSMRLSVCDVQNFNLHIGIDIFLLRRDSPRNLNAEKLILANRLRFVGELFHMARESITIKHRNLPQRKNHTAVNPANNKQTVTEIQIMISRSSY